MESNPPLKMSIKKIFSYLLLAALCSSFLFSGCSSRRKIRTAEDITPGNPKEKELDWKYGANDIRIQTTKVTKVLMDRWFSKTEASPEAKPRLIITEISNLTDSYISTATIRDIIEGVAVNDGRFRIVVGDQMDREEINALLEDFSTSQRYSSETRLESKHSTAAQFLAKIRLTKAVTQQPKYDLEDWRMTLTLYDIETGEVIDSTWDVLRKKVAFR